VLRVELGGGGGHGDPWSRPPDEVLRDVGEGYVSADRAKIDYGVVVTPAGRSWQLDEEGTAALRTGPRASA
jgi:N-methylhydantoinase B